jgi:hypothetical protein
LYHFNVILDFDAMGGLDRLVPLIAGPAMIDPGASVMPHARKLTAAGTKEWQKGTNKGMF